MSSEQHYSVFVSFPLCFFLSLCFSGNLLGPVATRKLQGQDQFHWDYIMPKRFCILMDSLSLSLTSVLFAIFLEYYSEKKWMRSRGKDGKHHLVKKPIVSKFFLAFNFFKTTNKKLYIFLKVQKLNNSNNNEDKNKLSFEFGE